MLDRFREFITDPNLDAIIEECIIEEGLGTLKGLPLTWVKTLVKGYKTLVGENSEIKYHKNSVLWGSLRSNLSSAVGPDVAGIYVAYQNQPVALVTYDDNYSGGNDWYGFTLDGQKIAKEVREISRWSNKWSGRGSNRHFIPPSYYTHSVTRFKVSELADEISTSIVNLIRSQTPEEDQKNLDFSKVYLDIYKIYNDENRRALRVSRTAAKQGAVAPIQGKTHERDVPKDTIAADIQAEMRARYKFIMKRYGDKVRSLENDIKKDVETFANMFSMDFENSMQVLIQSGKSGRSNSRTRGQSIEATLKSIQAKMDKMSYLAMYIEEFVTNRYSWGPITQKRVELPDGTEKYVPAKNEKEWDELMRKIDAL